MNPLMFVGSAQKKVLNHHVGSDWRNNNTFDCFYYHYYEAEQKFEESLSFSNKN